MIDFDRMLGRLLSGGGRGALGGAVVGGLVTSLLTTRRGRRVGGAAVKYGGLAAIGALVYRAVQQASSGGKGGTTLASAAERELEPPPAALLPARLVDRQSEAALLLRAMIAAAHADGAMDAKETKRLFDTLQEADLEPAEKGHLVGLMSQPPRLDEIVAEARGRETAARVYTASLASIDVDHPAEHAYLARLAAALGLEAEVVRSLHREMGAVEPSTERGGDGGRA